MKVSELIGTGGRWSAFMALAMLVACSESTGPAVETTVLRTNEFETPEVGIVHVCKVGPAGIYNFEITAPASSEPGVLLGDAADGAFTLAAGLCMDVWEAGENPGGSGQEATRVTVTEVDLPNELVLDNIEVDPGDFPISSPVIDVAGKNASVEANVYHGSVITFFNIEAPPEVPCIGLTPGYWKNWKNHYTEEQFIILVVGTIATDFNDATAILKKGGNDPLDKLFKFILATQLTINLADSDLPNPDGAGLGDDCTHPEFDETLGEALANALAIWADPGSFTKQEILDAKDVLDAFANLG